MVSLSVPRIGRSPRARGCWRFAFASLVALSPQLTSAEPVAVRHAEGNLHGFLVLRGPEGRLLADGDVVQTARGEQISVQMTFHFKDGSQFDETTVFSQRQQFKLVSYHLVQKGPAFPQSLDMSIDGANGDVAVSYSDDGALKETRERFNVPPDLANGMLGTLLKNVQSATAPKSVSFIAATPRPRMIKLAIESAGRDSFVLGGAERRATHYVIKPEIGGLAGLLAPLAGKQPPDSHVWILEGEMPVVVKAEQPFYVGSPLWRIELASPVWPNAPRVAEQNDDRVAAGRNSR